MKTFEGNYDASGLKIGIVATRFNEFITKKLLDGSLDCLGRHNCSKDDIDITWVPGAFEIPLAVKYLSDLNKYDAIVCLGCVLKGDTRHNEYIASEVIKGISKINLDTGIPISFGVITPDTLEQAIERAGTRSGNKGWEAALVAIEMVNLKKNIK